MENTKSESFEWVEGKPKVPVGMKGGYLKIVAKTTNPTHHANEPTRLFLPEELRENSRSLVGRTLTWNHGQEITNSVIRDSQYNEVENQIECTAFVPEYIIDKVKTGVVKNASIDFTWRSVETKTEGMVFHGLGIYGLSLLDIAPGDKDAVVTLFEDTTSSGRLGAIAEIKGEPFAGYTDFATCVAANQDKEDPVAYCGVIKAQTECATCKESEAPKEVPKEVPKVETPKEEPKVDSEKDELKRKVAELQSTIDKAQLTIKEIESKQKQGIKDARKAAISEIISDVEKVDPHPYISSRWGTGPRRYFDDVKRVIHRKKESLGE